jgi:hypothetical protein
MIAEELNAHPKLILIYSDEDKLKYNGQRVFHTSSKTGIPTFFTPITLFHI